MDRSRIIGLTAGSLWLIAAGAGFGTWALMMINTATSFWTLVALLAFASVLIATGIGIIVVAKRLPNSAAVKNRKLYRRFMLIVGIEVIALAIVNPVLAVTGHFRLLPALDLIIVGVHFVPLAWLFRVPRYYLMAFFFCAISLGTLLWLPAQGRIGSAMGWYAVPSIGCGLTAVLIGAANIAEAFRAVRRK